MSQEIANKIKQIVGSYDDHIEYAIGTVLSINDDSGDLINTCQVRLTSHKGIYNDKNSLQMIDDDGMLSSIGEIYFPPYDLNGNPILLDDISYIKNLHSEGLILYNVSLSVNNSNGTWLTIPVIGSEVLVIWSKKQRPFIAQYSNVEYSQAIYGSASFFAGRSFDNKGKGFEWNIIDPTNHLMQFVPQPSDITKSLFEVKANEVDLNNGGDIQIQFNNHGVGIHNGDPSIFISNAGQTSIEGKIILIKAEQQISIKNNSDSLVKILLDFIQDLESGTYIVTGSSAVLNPAGVLTLELIKNRLNALLAA